MSLYLGKLGRPIVGFAANTPRLGKALDKIGSGLAAISGGRWHTGLTRLAYQISQNAQIDSSTVILKRGMAVDENGTLLAQSNALTHDMFPITLTRNLASPEDFSAFLRFVYFHPESWGININPQHFDPAASIDLKLRAVMICNKLDMPLPPVFNVDKFSAFKGVFCSDGLDVFLLSVETFLASFMAVGHESFTNGTSSYSSLLGLLIVPLVYVYKTYMSWGFRGSYNKLFPVSTIHGFGPLTAWIQTDKTDPAFWPIYDHEFLHALEDMGFVRNDLLPEAVGMLLCLIEDRQIEQPKTKTAQVRILITRPDFFKRAWKSQINHSKTENQRNTYALGECLGKMAYDLAVDRNNMSYAWLLLKIMARSTTREEFLSELAGTEIEDIVKGWLD